MKKSNLNLLVMALLLFNARITLGNIIFNSLIDCEIQTSWAEIADRAIVKIPYAESQLNKYSEGRIKSGDPITIELGYDGEFIKEFEGYVVRVNPNTPITIECEDETYKLKRRSVNKSWSKVTLKELVVELVPDAVVDRLPDIELTNFLAEKTTVAKVLQHLTEEYKVVFFFQDKVLFGGLPYLFNRGPTYAFNFKENIFDEDLTFENEEDGLLKVRAVSFLQNNTKIEVEVGDPDGEEQTINFYNIESESELKKLAEEELKKDKYKGYRGSIVILGKPSLKHGQSVRLLDSSKASKGGTYFIESIEKSVYATGGYKQTLELDRQA